MSYKKQALEYLGIQKWHDMGYKGQGIKIMSDEKVCEKDHGDVISPKGFKSKRGHGDDVMLHIKYGAPEATFIAFPFSGSFGSNSYTCECAQYIMSNDVSIFTTSCLSAHASVGKEMAMQDCIDKGCIFFAAAGNDGDMSSPKESEVHGESRSEKYYAIGGVKPKWTGKYENNDEEDGEAIYDFSKIEPVRYSSEGPEMDFVTLAETHVAAGTSFCAPLFAAMVGLVQQFFIEKAGRKLTRAEMEKFIKDNVQDMKDEGFDYKTGHGLFRLPDPTTIDIKKYTGEAPEAEAPVVPEQPKTPNIGEGEMLLTIDSKDVQVGGITKTFDVAPFIKDNRTFVPIRVLEALGLSVEWKADTRQVIVVREGK